MEKQNICIKNVSFGELLTPWREKKRVWELSAKAEPLEIWFPSALALRYLRTCLHKAQKDQRSRKKSPLSSASQLPSPPPPFSYVFFQKDLMHIHTRLFISGIPGYMCLPPPNHLGSFCQYICLHPMENYSVSYNCVLGREIKNPLYSQ